jgi:hypothetical protein
MSTFKEYLSESKKTYSFKIKIAGEVDKKVSEQMKIALNKFDCTNVSKPKRTPITESPLDFPDQKFTHVNIFDVTCNYPANTVELATYLAEKLRVHTSCIRVKTDSEDAEQTNNIEAYKRIGTSTEALLSKPYEESNYQHLVGDKRLSFLQELGKVKHAGEQVKGVNDQLLAKSVPTGSSPKEKGR